MADVINRTTLQFLPSANTLDYPDPPWKINPDMSAVAGVPQKYWKWDAILDRPAEMTAPEKASLDSAQTNAARDAAVSQLDELENFMRAVVQVLRDELNLHADKMNAILTAIDTSTNYATLKTNIGLVADYPQRTLVQLRTSIRNKLGS